MYRLDVPSGRNFHLDGIKWSEHVGMVLLSGIIKNSSRLAKKFGRARHIGKGKSRSGERGTFFVLPGAI